MLKMDYRLLPEEACAWIAQTTQFRTWIGARRTSDDRPGNYVLALTGGRGTGKFLGTSYITKYMLDHEPRALVLNFSKLSWQTRPTTPHLMLKCLISELIDKRPEVLANVSLSRMSRSRLWKRFAAAGRSDDYGELLQLLSELLLCDQVSNVVLVIDGLDTCSQRPDILSDLVEICEKARIRLAVSDQNDSPVQKIYSNVQKLELQPGDIDCDVATYVSKQLKLHLPQRQALHQTVQAQIVTGAEGQLGWARHLLSCLCNAKDDDEFDAALTQAAFGKDMAVGRAFDCLRADDAFSGDREQLLLKSICRGLVKNKALVSVDALLAHCVLESTRYTKICTSSSTGRVTRIRPTFRFTVGDVKWVLNQLRNASPRLVREDNNSLFGYENDAVRHFFEHYLPPTRPQIPPLWLETDNCYVLSCHFASIATDLAVNEQEECKEHVEFRSNDWHETKTRCADSLSISERNYLGTNVI